MLLSSRQLHKGAHLQPVLQQARQDAALAATRDHNARPRRYALHLPYYDLKRVGSFGHGRNEDRVRGRRVGRSDDEYVSVRDHEGHGSELNVKPEELL